jgi:hypothetical protein
VRILFSAYCMCNNAKGDSLIGVYKRALRIALEMARRGHEVWIFCPGREDYQDELTRQAEGRLHFLDFGLKVLLCPSKKIMRRYYRRAFRRLQLDMVVLGESPLAGTLLESTICALTLGIRLVVLDNSYASWVSQAFIILQGWLYDGIVLTGPNSLQIRKPPEYYCAAPPYLEGTPGEAEALLERAGFRQQRLVTVLGYERKAEQLALALLPRLLEYNCAVVFLTPNLEECRKHLALLPPEITARTVVLPPPGEGMLFGLLQRSNLVIGKCGYMQVSECLALRTPFLAINYRGCFPVWFLPAKARRFLHTTVVTNASTVTLEAAVRLLQTSPDEMRDLHDGKFGARALVADFLERLPAGRRKRMTAWAVPRYRFTCFITSFAERIYGKMYDAASALERIPRRFSMLKSKTRKKSPTLSQSLPR